MAEIFDQLESSDKNVVETAKQSLRDLFTKVNEPWLLHGLYDLYLRTNSVLFLDILINIKEPHHNYLFDRLNGSLKSTQKKDVVQALTLLGHVATNQPTWLYKLSEHTLLQEILKLLKNEAELVPLISALLVLIILLPIMPDTMNLYLRQMFEIFSRLAGWNCSPPYAEDQMIHMQVALYVLFLRLYGMYPCNLVAYLKIIYKDGHDPVFVHTIKPMLETVKMHPSLVTGSKESETSPDRWKKMSVHDVIVECERFSLDLTDRCPHDCQFTSGFRSRSGTTNSNIENSYNLQSLKHTSTASSNSDSFFTPSSIFHTPPVTETTAPTNIPQPLIQGIHSSTFPSQEGTSPPEAAIEATPETTPVRDPRLTPKSQPSNSNVARALTSFGSKTWGASGSLNTTPTHSQPSSPMRKDFTQFTFMSDKLAAKKESLSQQKLSKMLKERAQINEESSNKAKSIPVPTSPLRILTDGARHQRTDLSVGHQDVDDDGISLLSMDSSNSLQQALRNSESTYEEEQEHGSPCTKGGLHMPNSKSMNSFAKNMQRLRYHSQCNPEPERTESSTGSSPGNYHNFSNSTTVRRANSCPEMKKSPVVSDKIPINTKPLDETDEETISEDKLESIVSNGVDKKTNNLVKCREGKDSETQTENFWPYELLFFVIFPQLGNNNEIKPSPAPSPAPLNLSQDRYCQPSIYETLDRYIETAVVAGGSDSNQALKDHLQLVHQHLLFERHRRETHADRNRRLLADAKSTRNLEECNSALRDQVHLHQREIENLRDQLTYKIKETTKDEKKALTTSQYWEKQYKILFQDWKDQKEIKENLELDISDLKSKLVVLDSQKQEAESSLLDALANVNIAREQALAGEKGRNELEQVNQELLMIGELHVKYEERFQKLSAIKQTQQELEYLKEAYSREIKVLTSLLEAKTATLEAYQARLSELEHANMKHEQTIASQKVLLIGINDEHHEKLNAVESKYSTQLTINRALEEKILDLRQRNDLISKRSVNSPDTSSCHEVNVTTTDRTAGLSAHSSPLSTSLASSEGSMAFHDVREVRNIQALVDQRDTAEAESSSGRNPKDS